ncbi:hypothetical protein [Croceiramulus getboli]|nr:hypothetical protein P8624_04515 [Flavobacteriaceae bacterium YJPT1-3]
MKENEVHDLDLTHVLNGIKKFFKGILVAIYHGVSFIVRKAVILMVLFLVGLGIGLVWDSFENPKRSINLLVQPNVNSTPYVYDAISLLNSKIKQKDTVFLLQTGVSSKALKSLKEISIDPVINVRDILDKYQGYSEGQTIQLLKNLNDEEDFSQNETFHYDYKYHTVTLTLGPKGTEESLQPLLDFVEKNDALQKERGQLVSSYRERLKSNAFTLAQVDSLLVNVNATLADKNDFKGQQLIAFGSDAAGMEGILEQKERLLEENTKLRSELIQLDRLLYVINDPEVIKNQVVVRNKFLFTPVVLVLLFLLFNFLIWCYKIVEGYAHESD